MYVPFFLLFFFSCIAIEAGEASDEEEDRIKRVVNFPIHAFSDLTTLAKLFECRFGLDPSSNAPTSLIPSIFLLFTFFFIFTIMF